MADQPRGSKAVAATPLDPKQAKRQARAAKQAEKARRKASTDPADMGRMRQIKRAYTLTHEYDKQLPLWVFGPWVAILVTTAVDLSVEAETETGTVTVTVGPGPSACWMMSALKPTPWLAP